MKYEEALARFKTFGNFCDDYDDCDGDCKKCEDMESRIIEAMERQIPKKLQEYELYTEDGELVHYEGCPNCRAILNKSHYFLKICHCGQKLEV